MCVNFGDPTHIPLETWLGTGTQTQPPPTSSMLAIKQAKKLESRERRAKVDRDQRSERLERSERSDRLYI